MSRAGAARAQRLTAAGEAYRHMLEQQLRAPEEAVLSQAYRLGRELLASDASLLEVASLHHRALARLAGQGAGLDAKGTEAAGLLLCEALAGYEMLLRGTSEANAALRGMNERLELQVERLAHTLHDESGQLLAAVMIALDQLHAATLEEPRRQELQRIRDLLDRMEVQLRQLAHELHPALLADLGLQPALEFLGDGVGARSGLIVTVEGKLERRLPAVVELCLYRCVQEALNNVVRHARARRVRIVLRPEEKALEIRVADDGAGFDPAALAASGMGLAGMRERLRTSGGELELHSRPGAGTELRFRISNVLWGGNHVTAPSAG